MSFVYAQGNIFLYSHNQHHFDGGTNRSYRFRIFAQYQNGDPRQQGVEMSLPIIQLGSNERLMLRFDELGDNSNYYRYRIDHCTHDWQISDISASDYMNGFEDGAIDNQQFSFTTIEHYTNYWQTIPNDISSFATSGNYLLTVYLQSDPDSIVFTRRFKVYEPMTTVEASVGKVQGSMGLMENQNLSVKVNPLEGN